MNEIGKRTTREPTPEINEPTKEGVSVIFKTSVTTLHLQSRVAITSKKNNLVCLTSVRLDKCKCWFNAAVNIKIAQQ